MTNPKTIQKVLFGMAVLLMNTGYLYSQNAEIFGFFGYMRSGFGLDGKGGPLEVFKAPNSEAKYRLGNEAEAYVEATFRYAYQDAGKALFESNLTLAFVTPKSKSNSFFQPHQCGKPMSGHRGL